MNAVNPVPTPLNLVIDNHVDAYTWISLLASKQEIEEGVSSPTRSSDYSTMPHKESPAHSYKTSASAYSQDSYDSVTHSNIDSSLFSDVPLSSAEGSLTPAVVETNILICPCPTGSPAHEARTGQIRMDRDSSTQREVEGKFVGIEAGKRSKKRRATYPQSSKPIRAVEEHSTRPKPWSTTTTPLLWEGDEERWRSPQSPLRPCSSATTACDFLDSSPLPLTAGHSSFKRAYHLVSRGREPIFSAFPNNSDRMRLNDRRTFVTYKMQLHTGLRVKGAGMG